MKILTLAFGATVATTVIGLMTNPASALTFAQNNLQVLNEAILTTRSSLVLSSIIPTNTSFNFLGSFDESGWSGTVSDSNSSLPINLSFNAQFNTSLNVGTFSGSGTVGTYILNSSGSYSFTDLSSSITSLNFSNLITVVPSNPAPPAPLPPPIVTRTETFGKTTVIQTLPNNGGTLVTDSGIIRIFLVNPPNPDKLLSQTPQTSQTLIPPPPPPPRPPLRCTLDSNDGTSYSSLVIFSSFPDCSGGSVNGRITSIPEPASTLSLLALGTLGAASTLKRKLKPSKSAEKETTKVG